MWTMMSGPGHSHSFDNNNHNYNDYPNGPRHVYVHHVNEDHHPMGYHQQQYAQPQPMYIPMPMPIPQPQPMMPMFMGGGYGCHAQMGQPPVIIINGSGEQTSDSGGGGGESKKEESSSSSSSSASPFHPVSFVSVIFFIIASILGFICVAKIYDVFESSMNANNNNYDSEQQQQQQQPNDYYENSGNQGYDDHILDYLVVHRTVALGMGAASIMMFSIAFLLSFYAGMRARLKNKCSKKKGKNCCMGGLLIAAWILFCLTFINGLIILVLAFDEEARIYPEVALTAVIGNMCAWMCMFGYSQLARRV